MQMNYACVEELVVSVCRPAAGMNFLLMGIFFFLSLCEHMDSTLSFEVSQGLILS